MSTAPKPTKDGTIKIRFDLSDSGPTKVQYDLVHPDGREESYTHEYPTKHDAIARAFIALASGLGITAFKFRIKDKSKRRKK
jgi:hypothetical protein